MRSIVFEGNTWRTYENLRSLDKKIHKNLCRTIKEMQREDPAKGLGKPEQLKYELSGFWSRRLTHSDRLIYKFDDTNIYIFAIGGHYDNIKNQFDK